MKHRYAPSIPPPAWAMKPLTRNMSTRMTPKARTKFKGSSLKRLNQYEVLKPLGQGATSLVYLCRYDASGVLSEEEIKRKEEERKRKEEERARTERKKRGAVADLRTFDTVVDVCDMEDDEEEEEENLSPAPPPKSPSRGERFRSGQMFALKVFSRSKMRNNIISWGSGGGDVVTALDQVQSEVALMKKLRHENLVRGVRARSARILIISLKSNEYHCIAHSLSLHTQELRTYKSPISPNVTKY